MEIRPLDGVPLKEIIDCFLEAFSTYALKMPEDVDYWAWRFNAARVDYSMSLGAFENNKMIGFIIIGVDQLDGVKTSFNTGTGVIESCRGRKIIDQLYLVGIPIWKKVGIERCSLEVITSNELAIRVYERIGFEKFRTLHSYIKETEHSIHDVIVEQMDIDIMLNIPHIDQTRYSWDFTNQALKQSPGSIRAYAVINSSNKLFGYFSVNETHRSICQLELVDDENKQDWLVLLKATNQLWDGTIKINNVDYRRTDLIAALAELQWDNHVSQYEMNMEV